MSLPAKLLALAVVVAASALALHALATPDGLVLLGLTVIGIAAVGAVSLIALLDLVVRAARQVFGRVETPSR